MDKEEDPEVGQPSIFLKDIYNIDPTSIKSVDEYAKVMFSNGKRVEEIKKGSRFKMKEDDTRYKYRALSLKPSDSMSLVNNLPENSFEQYGFGCILGNFLADAVGAKDEFQG
jgi:hypothetical protein